MTPQGHQTGDISHERTDVDVIGVFLLIGVLLLLLAICLFGVGGLVRFLSAHRPRPLTVTSRSAGSFPQPRLQSVPGVDLSKDEGAQQHELNSYGWTDRAKGVAHIPIDRAMQLLIERGLPDVGAGQTRLQLMQARPETNAQSNETIPVPAPSASP